MRILGLFFALSCPSAVAATSLELREFRIGMSRDDIRLAYPDFACIGESSYAGGFKTCMIAAPGGKTRPWVSGLESFAGSMALRWSIDLSADDKLGEAEVALSSNDFESVVEAIANKYGKPTRAASNIEQNRMGAKFQNRLIVWQRGDLSLEVRRFAGSLDTTTVTLSSQKFVKARVAAEKALLKQRKDL